MTDENVMNTGLLIVEGTSAALRDAFRVRDDARICFVDTEPGDWGKDDERYLASHECVEMMDRDLVIELWAHPDSDPACPWFAYWQLHQPLNCMPTSVNFCPYCGLNLNTLYADPFFDVAVRFDDQRGKH